MYLQTYVADKLLVVKGWRHQLAILRKNGSYIRYVEGKRQGYGTVFPEF